MAIITPEAYAQLQATQHNAHVAQYVELQEDTEEVKLPNTLEDNSDSFN